MKYLLLLLISFNLSAMSLEKIEGLTVQKAASQLLQRLDKTCVLKDSEKPYSFSNLECEGGNPSIEELKAELTVLKDELFAEENIRLAEKARIKDIKDRLKALKHRNSSMRKILKKPNPAAWLRDNISKMDHALIEAKLVEIEAQDLVQESEYQVQVSKENVFKSAKERLRSADCSTEASQIAKDVCIILQR